ncbi:MAG: roadblock/LC7 domain-containing protein [Coleofasciculus sp. G1-WW12-02]|uniref:roadblock/LC7 domain-containing protein n=1 Tax=Coleofasciculus sp. G1-WW12-02 TaxID=3068483 RepID=UPI0032F7AD94
MAINPYKLGGILKTFVSNTPEVEGAAMITPDGLPLAASLPVGMNDERVSAISAAMLSLAERIGKELIGGEIDRICVESNQGLSILTRCGQEAVFLVLASQAAKPGLLRLEIQRTIAKINLFLSYFFMITSVINLPIKCFI